MMRRREWIYSHKALVHVKPMTKESCFLSDGATHTLAPKPQPTLRSRSEGSPCPDFSRGLRARSSNPLPAKVHGDIEMCAKDISQATRSQHHAQTEPCLRAALEEAIVGCLGRRNPLYLLDATPVD